MVKVHKITNYDHEVIKKKDFTDIYNDPDIIKLKRKEKLIDVWSNVMVVITMISLLVVILTSVFEWSNSLFTIFSIIAAGAITLNYLPDMANWSNFESNMNIIRIETSDIMYDRHIQGAKSTQILLGDHDDDFCVVKVIAEKDNEEVDELDLLLYYKEKSNIDEVTYDVKECTIYHPKNK